MKTTFQIKCPYCNRSQTVRCFKSVPRQRFDCKECGAVADVSHIMAIRHGDTWSVDWAHHGVDA